MIDNSLVADIYENEQPNAEIEEDDVEIEVSDFVSLGLGGGEDGFSPIVSLSKIGKVTTLEITDKNGKQTAKIYDGDDGHRGTGILNVTTAPQNYIFAVGGKFPKKRMLLSTICAESGVNNVLVGDIIAYESEHCHVYYIDSTYAYMDTVVSVKGADGADGKDGTTVQWHFPSTFPSNVMDYKDGDIIVDVWNGYVYIANHSTGQFEFTRLVLQGEQGDQGVSIIGAYININDDLVLELSDGNELLVGGKVVPVKGVDYFTETDKAEMVASVISALPVYGGEVESV